MSASLVGSEMCIRDRQSASPQSGGPQSCLSPQISWYQARLRTLKGAFQTVSYTHLTLPTICSV
eukprot:760994-Alexandrium_andersonii.AAC.1